MAAVATTAPDENPLIAGLERLPVAPTTLVIFGATGDLAKRKLLPALYNLACDGALPERFHLVGVSRKEKEHSDYRSECEQAIRSFSRRTPDENVLKRLLEHVKYVPGTFDDPSVYTRAREGARPLRRARRREAEPGVLPVNRALLLPGDRGGTRQAGARLPRGSRRARDNREAVWHLAGGGARAQPARAGSVRGVPGVSHRSLPGQGDGAEHDGVPLRQRHVRAAVEPQLHRPGADHRRGGHRDRHARGLLRQRGGAARSDPEPHVAAAVPRGDGAAGELHRR